MRTKLIALLAALLAAPLTANPLLMLAGPVASAPAGYTASSATFDGVNDSIKFSSSAVTFAAGKQFTVSVWINPSGADGASNYIAQGRDGTSGAQWRVARDSGNGFTIVATNAANSAVLSAYTQTNVAEAADGWVHLLFSVDLNGGSGAGLRHCYVNGTAASMTWTTYNDDPMALDRTGLNIGIDDSNGNDFAGDMGELWVDDTYIDFSIQANREKFILAGAPVSLGAGGATPTGSAPDLYMKFVSGSLAVNSGADGGTGTIAGEVASGPTFP